jgi:hypothetical protein
MLTQHCCFHFISTEIDYDICWLYRGPAYWDDGYPIINRHGKNWVASRFVWYYLTGRDYHKREVHHKCKTRNCVNPFHLEELRIRKHRRLHNAKQSKL